jgi:hypothetical protein
VDTTSLAAHDRVDLARIRREGPADRNSRCVKLGQERLLGGLESSDSLIPAYGGEILEEFVEWITRLEIVEECLKWHTCADKYGRAAKDFWIAVYGLS